MKTVFSLHSIRASHYRQRGAVLLVSLIMLLLLTVVGTAAMNISTMDTKMTANSRDRQIAFQSAETGLVAAEDLIDVEDELPEKDANVGYIGEVIATNKWWSANDEAWWADNSDKLGKYDAYSGEQAPLFVVEYPTISALESADGSVSSGGFMLGGGPPEPKMLYFRSTSKGEGPGGSKVTLQSVYALKAYSNPL